MKIQIIDQRLMLSLGSLIAILAITACKDSNQDISATDSDTGQTLGNDPLTANLMASREACVAPCFVRLDGTGTTSGSTSSAFHEIAYVWDFGDPNSGLWSQGAAAQSGSPKSRNKAFGALAAHVFDPERYGDSYDEDCGLGPNSCKRYTVTLSVEMGDEAGSKTVTIEVDDPNVHFADSTACISTSTDFSDCPTTQSVNHFQIGTSSDCDDWDDCVNMAINHGYKRILSRRGDSFDADDNVGNPSITDLGATHIGAFGSGNNPTIQTTAQGVFVNWSDARIDSLAFVGNPGGTLQEIPAFAIQFSEVSHALLYRCALRDYVNLIIHKKSGTGANGIVENVIGPTFYETGSFGHLGDGDNLSLLGNQISGIDGNTRAHTLYFAGGNKLLVAHNRIGPSAAVHDEIGLYQGDAESSRYTIISDNYLVHDTGDASFNCCEKGFRMPSDGLAFEDVIFENNLTTTAGGSDGLFAVQLAFVHDVTVRNNLFVLDDINMMGLQVTHHTDEDDAFAAKTIRVYNNSVFTSDDHVWKSWWPSIFNAASKAVSDVDFRNNLMWSSSPSDVPVFTDCGETQGCTDAHNWDRLDSELGANPYSSDAPVTPEDFELHSFAAQPVDAGEDLPAIFTDFWGEDRPSPIDIGACEFRDL